MLTSMPAWSIPATGATGTTCTVGTGTIMVIMVIDTILATRTTVARDGL